MLKTIFEVGLKRKVKTEMVSSIVRGGKSCVYKVIIEGLSKEEKQMFAEA